MNPDDGRSLVLLLDVNVYFEFNGRGRRSSTYRVLPTADKSIPSHANTNFNAPVKLVVIIQLSTPISYSLSLETLTHFHMATHRNANRYPQISIHPSYPGTNRLQNNRVL